MLASQTAAGPQSVAGPHDSGRDRKDKWIARFLGEPVLQAGNITARITSELPIFTISSAEWPRWSVPIDTLLPGGV